MTRISLIKPLDQPLGRRRLLEELREGLGHGAFDRLRVCVAFAATGPLLRLAAEITAWRAAGKRIEGIFGVDLGGTSRQALEFALSSFDDVYFIQEGGLTFHPKIYLFDGVSEARVFVGSNNLTVGGTETNFESTLRLDMRLPADTGLHNDLRAAWEELLPDICPATTKLTPIILAQLVAGGIVPDERGRGRRESFASTGDALARQTGRRSGLEIKPPSALPRQSFETGGSKSQKALPIATEAAMERPAARGFVLQIKTHANGEIFLSKRAAEQDPEFFGLPFSGTTTPKKAGNAAYPQRTPDPLVNIVVYGVADKIVLTLNAYSLNTVFYIAKSEIRVTASPLVGVVPDYSILIMEPGDEENVDYEMTILVPGNPRYGDWLEVCNQTMPGGGSTPRNFGWF